MLTSRSSILTYLGAKMKLQTYYLDGRILKLRFDYFIVKLHIDDEILKNCITTDSALCFRFWPFESVEGKGS